MRAAVSRRVFSKKSVVAGFLNYSKFVYKWGSKNMIWISPSNNFTATKKINCILNLKSRCTLLRTPKIEEIVAWHNLFSTISKYWLSANLYYKLPKHIHVQTNGKYIAEKDIFPLYGNLQASRKFWENLAFEESPAYNTWLVDCKL